jgi:hypothetical protein
MWCHVVHTYGTFGWNIEVGCLLFGVPQTNIESRGRRALARITLCRLGYTRWTGMIRPIWSTHTHVMVERTQSVVGTGNRILFTRGTCFCHTGTCGHGWDELFWVTGQGQG